MLSVCVDARMVNNSGIGVYTRKYITHLLAQDEFRLSLIGKGQELDGYFGSSRNWHLIPSDAPIYSVQEQIKLPLLIPACDLFWSPHYNIPLSPTRARKRLVTVPDVFHLAHLETLSPAQKIYASVVTNAAVRWSDKVLTISKFSEQEIIRLTGVRAGKVKAIHLGLDTTQFRYVGDIDVQREVRERYQLPQQYVLFVGNVKPNKNLRALVSAFAELAPTMPELHLLIAGKKDGFITGDRTLFNQIDQNRVLTERIVFSGYVAADDLPVLYSMAQVFAFPSLYEGFGFPPLEAMACGCPVVASNRGSIPEICGDAALYINPADPTELANGIRQVLTDAQRRDELIRRGGQKVAEYNWPHSQRQFEQEVRELAGKA